MHFPMQASPVKSNMHSIATAVFIHYAHLSVTIFKYILKAILSFVFVLFYDILETTTIHVDNAANSITRSQ